MLMLYFRNNGIMTFEKNSRKLKQIKISILLASISLIIYFYQNYQNNLITIQNEYIKDQKVAAAQVSNAIEIRFKYLYQTIKTISLLPSIRELEPQSNISNEIKGAIQQIYNNAFDNIQMSEIYIVQKEFNPNRLDIKPQLTFENMIQKNLSLENKKLEEEEYEYQEIKKQIDYFQLNFPQSNISLNAISSTEVITCDYSNYTVEDYKAGNNKPRNGIVYSVPIYNQQNIFKGIVSAILRSDIISQDLPSNQYISIQSGDKNFKRNVPTSSLEKNNQSTIVNFQQDLKINDRSNTWTILVKYPDYLFWNLSAVNSLKQTLGLSILIVLLFAYISYFFFSNSIKGEMRLEKKIEERISDIEKLRALTLQQEKMASLGEMAGGIAHEINTPLAIISMKVEQLKDSIEENDFDSKEFNYSLDVISKTTNRIAIIIKGLHSFARDGSKMQLEQVSIKNIISDTLSFCSEKIRLKNIILEVEYLEPNNDYFINCRPVEISQVILNLLNNATDAVANLNDKWIKISVKDTDQNTELSMTDSGSGIPEEIQDKIMQPFFTTKEIGMGTGLGLSVSKGIITSHHGEIIIDKKNKNTKIIIVLPKSVNKMEIA